ncbi:hypothetical protein [Rhodobacter sp. NSM]|uniref:hypothetical protein n=1 Tax=Rhodobacter sp. NSM TaxID=3457501 RepID=UPI003FCFC236
MRRSVQSGDTGLQLPPMLLYGPPGIGKSRWASRLAGLIGVPDLIFEILRKERLIATDDLRN